jgi:hypothetical protein
MQISGGKPKGHSIGDAVSLLVPEFAHYDKDKIDQCPYSQAAKGKKHQYARTYLAGIEAVYAKASQKNAEQQRGQPVFFHNYAPMQVYNGQFPLSSLIDEKPHCIRVPEMII